MSLMLNKLRTVKPSFRSEGKGTARKPESGSLLAKSSTSNCNKKGLAPRVQLRPPATTSIFTNLDLEDDDILNNTSEDSYYEGIANNPLLASPSPPVKEKGTPMETEPIPERRSEEDPPDRRSEEDPPDTAGKLLKMKKNYKRISVSLAKAKAHFSFVSACKTEEKTPRGLKINVKCSAFLADHTNIRDEFTKTSNMAEKSYVSDLNGHYSKVVDELAQKQSLLINTMKTLETGATIEEKEAHANMLLKTESNVQKLSLDLEKRKKRKLDNLSQPPQQKRRRIEAGDRQMGRGGPRGQWRSPVGERGKGRDGTSEMMNGQTWSMYPPPPPPQTFLTPQTIHTPQPPNLLNMTLSELLLGIQRQALQPGAVTQCTPGGQPPMLVHAGGKVGQSRAPQLPLPFQHEGSHLSVQPPQLAVGREPQDFTRRGRPHLLQQPM